MHNALEFILSIWNAVTLAGFEAATFSNVCAIISKAGQKVPNKNSRLQALAAALGQDFNSNRAR
jgi:hypothetical protein